MTNSNKMFHTKINLADFDACSLYPCATALLGYLMGLPKILPTYQVNCDFLQSVDGYFVKIKITKVGKHRQFPLLNKLSNDKVRQPNNSMVGEMVYVDKNTLEDLIEFQHVEFDVDVVQGIMLTKEEITRYKNSFISCTINEKK